MGRTLRGRKISDSPDPVDADTAQDAPNPAPSQPELVPSDVWEGLSDVDRLLLARNEEPIAEVTAAFNQISGKKEMKPPAVRGKITMLKKKHRNLLPDIKSGRLVYEAADIGASASTIKKAISTKRKSADAEQSQGLDASGGGSSEQHSDEPLTQGSPSKRPKSNGAAAKPTSTALPLETSGVPDPQIPDNAAASGQTVLGAEDDTEQQGGPSSAKPDIAKSSENAPQSGQTGDGAEEDTRQQGGPESSRKAASGDSHGSTGRGARPSAASGFGTFGIAAAKATAAAPFGSTGAAIFGSNGPKAFGTTETPEFGVGVLTKPTGNKGAQNLGTGTKAVGTIGPAKPAIESTSNMTGTSSLPVTTNPGTQGQEQEQQPSSAQQDSYISTRLGYTGLSGNPESQSLINRDFDIHANEIKKVFSEIKYSALHAITTIFFDWDRDEIAEDRRGIARELNHRLRDVIRLVTGQAESDTAFACFVECLNNDFRRSETNNTMLDAHLLSQALLSALLTVEVYTAKDLAQSFGVPGYKDANMYINFLARHRPREIRTLEARAARYRWRDCRKWYFESDEVKAKITTMANTIFDKYRDAMVSVMDDSGAENFAAANNRRVLLRAIEQAIKLKCRLELSSQKYEIRWVAAVHGQLDWDSMMPTLIVSAESTQEVVPLNKNAVRLALSPAIFMSRAADDNAGGLEAVERELSLAGADIFEGPKEGPAFAERELVVPAEVKMWDGYVRERPK